MSADKTYTHDLAETLGHPTPQPEPQPAPKDDE